MDRLLSFYLSTSTMNICYSVNCILLKSIQCNVLSSLFYLFTKKQKINIIKSQAKILTIIILHNTWKIGPHQCFDSYSNGFNLVW